MISNYLPADASSVLDIGCGLGLIDLAIYKHYKDNCKLYLLDKTNSIDENTSVRGFNQKYIFYNSLDSTKTTLADNGVLLQDINTFEVSDEAVEELSNRQFDIILSLLSCGWHYPIETYVNLIKKSLKPEGLLILDIRHDTGQLEYAKEHFELLHTIINTAESKHTGGTIGDRYIFKLK
jgi:SAM-dependent methyltransferase